MDNEKAAEELVNLAKTMVAAGRGTPAERIREAINLIDFLPNMPRDMFNAYGGNEALAKESGRIIREVADELREILVAMPESVIYKVYMDKEHTFKNPADLIKFMERSGMKHDGFTRSTGMPELRNQPKFKGMAGPMVDGGGEVRYETWEIYKQLST